ncbi:MAG TPA: TIGR01212 family radical SAM protein [Pirellulaceae bacterium]|nr:TIGR01212 family radical SAM protein [Pirellulaceae bacterium]HMO93858.1 TIGR01212 family radical SAM protein [Pirellulaceae bacterium]HMP71118.1 TIGR01212 family radical SAM protein [Pirellulaceae bacterium]
MICRDKQFDWRADGLRYYTYNYFLRRAFGHRVQRVSVDAGFTCPNVDGTVALGGCTFCDNRSFSPSRRLPKGGILKQIDEGIRRLKTRYKCDHFTAYFQPATNTYAPVDELRELYFEAISHPQVVALSIGTRPDCVPDDVLNLLTELASRIPLTVEYGMQTMHDASLHWMNRGHDHDVTVDAMERSVGRGFELCAHIMLGLPGETKSMMLDSGREAVRLGFDAVKIHNLYAVKHTPLADQVARGEVQLMSMRDYIDTVVEFLELLPEHMVVERISGEAPPVYLIGPSWCLDKPAIIKALDEEMVRRDTWQGKYSA